MISDVQPQSRRAVARVSARLLRRLATTSFVLCLLLLAATTVLQFFLARAGGRSLLEDAEGRLGTLPFTAAFFFPTVIGYLIARREPSNVIGWLLLTTGLCWVARAFFFDSYLPWTLIEHPGSLPGASVVGGLTFPLWVPAAGLPGTLLILLFPDGRLSSHRRRLLGWACAATIVGLYLSSVVRPGPVEQAPVADLDNPFAVQALEPVLPALDALVLLLPICMVGCAVSAVLRFRRSRGVERLQLKWLAASGAVVGAGYLSIMVGGAYAAVTDAGPGPQWIDVVSAAVVLSFALIPMAIGIAVLKYKLYGIDRLISRTLSYALVTGILLAVYVGLVTLVGRLTPSSNALAVAASTLTVAALFQPLRRGIQTRVDRRFNRSRYDADQTVAAFARMLRDEVDLDAVRNDLLRVVQQTVQPATAGLWLRGDGRS
jgi:hypothetical protein